MKEADRAVKNATKARKAAGAGHPVKAAKSAARKTAGGKAPRRR